MGVPGRGGGVRLRLGRAERRRGVRVPHAREGVRGVRRELRPRGRPRVQAFT